MNLNFENELALHASPTLIKIKVASLFNYVIKPSDDVNEIICDYINALSKYNLKLKVFCRCNKRILVYIYNHTQLENLIFDNKDFLNEHGYQDCTSVEKYLNTLILKINNQKDFPHEIGFFLGYPLEDVKSFIEHKGKNYLHYGYWKVYHNKEEALKTFERYTKIQKYMSNRIAGGNSIINCCV